MARALVAGAGYVGMAVAARLSAAGHEVFVARRAFALGEAERAGAIPIEIDLRSPSLASRLPGGIELAFFTAAPDDASEAAYRAVYVEALAALVAALGRAPQTPARLVITSSTSVYAQDDGGWVDESSPAEARDATAACVLEGERIALEAPFSAVVLRLGGIYGPGRARLVGAVRCGTATLAPGPERYVNRIHRDDAAAAIVHLATLERPALIHLGVDDKPASANTVTAFIAARLGLPAPPTSSDNTGVRRGRGSHKRCRNALLRATGWAPAYPTYREGYGALVDAGEGA